MESALEQKMDDAMKMDNVRGVVCTDLHGLCLGQRGAATQELAGPIAALCDEANKQWPSQDQPVIVLDTAGSSGASSSLLVKMVDGICTGILKDKN